MPHTETGGLVSPEILKQVFEAFITGGLVSPEILKQVFEAAINDNLEQLEPDLSCQPTKPDQHTCAELRQLVVANIGSIIEEAKKSYIFNKYGNAIKIQLLSHYLQRFAVIRDGDLRLQGKKGTGTVTTWENTVGNMLQHWPNAYLVPHPSHRSVYQFTDLALCMAGEVSDG